MNDVAEESPRARRRLLIGCLAVGMLFLLVLTAFIAFWIGRINEEHLAQVRRQETEVAQIKRFLSQHPDRFGSLIFNRGPREKYLVQGSVQTDEDLQLLKAELTRLFGEARMNQVLNVTVSEEP